VSLDTVDPRDTDPSPTNPRATAAGPAEASSREVRSRRGRPRPAWQRLLLTCARPAAAVLIVAAIGYAVVSQWNDVRAALTTLAWPSVVLSLLAALAGTLTSLMAWRALLADEGHRLSPVAAGRIFLVGQLGKYLPGSVWAIVLQMELGRRAGVPRARAFTASLAFVGLSLSTGLCVGLVGAPVLADAHSNEVWLLLAALPVALIASAPPVLTRLMNLVLALGRKSPLPRPLSWTGVLSAAAWLTATWVLFGLHLWLLADALGAPGWGGVSRCIGGFALAMAAGVLFVFVPSGAGVREALIVAALAPVMPAGAALGIAVVSRAVFIVTDVLSAGVAALSARRHVRADVAGSN
jgi:glycosyltransferase 2 family protein